MFINPLKSADYTFKPNTLLKKSLSNVRFKGELLGIKVEKKEDLPLLAETLSRLTRKTDITNIKRLPRREFNKLRLSTECNVKFSPPYDKEIFHLSLYGIGFNKGIKQAVMENDRHKIVIELGQREGNTPEDPSEGAFVSVDANGWTSFLFSPILSSHLFSYQDLTNPNSRPLETKDKQIVDKAAEFFDGEERDINPRKLSPRQ